ARVRLLEAPGYQRIAEGEQHREAHADDEGGVDQTQQQEDLRLKRRDHLWLPCSAFEKARAHDPYADARAERAQPDDEADADAGEGLDLRDQLQLVHLLSFLEELDG